MCTFNGIFIQGWTQDLQKEGAECRRGGGELADIAPEYAEFAWFNYQGGGGELAYTWIHPCSLIQTTTAYMTWIRRFKQKSFKNFSWFQVWQPLLFESERCENSFANYKINYEKLWNRLNLHDVKRGAWIGPHLDPSLFIDSNNNCLHDMNQKI